MSKNYVVTGTSRGLGLEMTRQLLDAGHTVHALARVPSESFQLIELKEKHTNNLFIYPVDVTSDHQVEAFIRDLPKDTVIDILINNAGVYGDPSDFEKLSLEKVESTFSNNAVAPMRMTRALLKYLKRSETPKVIQITSLMGSIHDNASGGHYAYRMSKAALNMFNKSFSVDYPKIVSLVLHPGWVRTDMGGAAAPIGPATSAAGLLQLIEDATLNDTGKFFAYDGDELGW